MSYCFVSGVTLRSCELELECNGKEATMYYRAVSVDNQWNVRQRDARPGRVGETVPERELDAAGELGLLVARPTAIRQPRVATWPAVHRHPDHGAVCRHTGVRRGRQHQHLHRHLQEQAHAHRYQLLPVQSGHFRLAAARLRPASGDVLHLVQVSGKLSLASLNFKQMFYYYVIFVALMTLKSDL